MLGIVLGVVRLYSRQTSSLIPELIGIGAVRLDPPFGVVAYPGGGSPPIVGM